MNIVDKYLTLWPNSVLYTKSYTEVAYTRNRLEWFWFHSAVLPSLYIGFLFRRKLHIMTSIVGGEVANLEYTPL